MARRPGKSAASSSSAKPGTAAQPKSGARLIWLAVGIVAAIAAAAGAWWLLTPARPHAFVLISIDTMRADRLPVYGYAKGSTPALTALAQEAVTFERAYAHAPQTLPSHASMLTGRLPFEHQVRDNLGFTLGPGPTTLAEMFRSAGYLTAGFVSAYVLRPETGVGRGFAVYDAAFTAAASDSAPAEIVRTGPATLEATTAWLETLADDKFFLFFHIYEPHTPYAPPARFTQPDRYDGEIAFSDEIVGQLIAVLRQRGWYDDATIVVTSDHGEGLGEHGEQEHGLFVYESTIRVPLLVKQPGGKRGGARVADPVQHIDLAPTFAGLAGLTLPADLRGRSLVPALERGSGLAPQGIYAEALYPRYHFGWSELTALVDGRYKYIRAPRPELYDLERDPQEQQNVIADRAQAASALRSGLEAMVAGRVLDAPSAVSASDRERLAALGYVGSSSPVATETPGDRLPDPKDKVAVLETYRQAIELISNRRYEDGLARLRSVLDDNPDMTDVWMQYATTNIRLGRHEQAYQAYREIISRKPTEANALLGASSVLQSLNRMDEARKYAELAVSVSPAQAHHVLANIAMRQNRNADAIREAELAAQADPTLPAPQLVRGVMAYHQQRYAEALPLLMAARDAYARRTMQTNDLHFYIGDALARLQRYEEAEPYFQQEIRLYPMNARARAGLAMLYQSMGRPAEAEQAIAEMLRVSPTPVAFEHAEYLWNMFGRPDRAAAARAEARKRYPGVR